MQMDAREELLEQAGQLVLSGRAVALVAADHEALSSLLGELAMSLIEFGGEIVRLDAMVSHQPEALPRALADALQVPESELTDVLRLRGDTSNPLVLLVDNAECLSVQAMARLGDTMARSSGGLGLALAGEPELVDMLDGGPVVELVFDADELDVPLLAMDDDEERDALVLPWKHISAVVGLLLLIWLLWPRAEDQTPEVQTLTLPEPVVIPEVVAEPDGEPSLDPVVAEAVAPFDSEPEVAIESPAVEEEVVELTPEQAPEPTAVAPVTPAPVTPQPEQPAESVRPLTGMAAELGYRQEDWLLAQSPENWVLQLASGASETSARSVLDRLGVARGAYYRTRRNSDLVYIALAGVWDSREAALAGKAELPAEFRDGGAFPRQINQIQAEILADLR